MNGLLMNGPPVPLQPARVPRSELGAPRSSALRLIAAMGADALHHGRQRLLKDLGHQSVSAQRWEGWAQQVSVGEVKDGLGCFRLVEVG